MKTVTYDIRLDSVSNGYDGKMCWVHVRGGAIPGKKPFVVMLMQKLLVSASDVFCGIHDMYSYDMGKTWVGPTPQSAFGQVMKEDGVIERMSDFFPSYHKLSNKILATGQTIKYLNDQVIIGARGQVAYVTYDLNKHSWTKPKMLKLPNDDSRFYATAAGCCQPYDLQNGDILLPIAYGHKPLRDMFLPINEFLRSSDDIKKSIDPEYATVVRCGFDGENLVAKDCGDEFGFSRDEILRQHGGKVEFFIDTGLCEPSLTRFRDKYFLTLRNGLTGYAASSEDGLHYDGIKPWTFDDGTNLGNYNTQQHWVTHSDGLFLVYTRRGANNDNVYRHRAPLFIGQVDPDKLCVIRSTERILVPNRGARLCNFGVADVSHNETWVTVSEWMQNADIGPDLPVPDPFACARYGSDNTIYAARIIWDTPNKLVSC